MARAAESEAYRTSEKQTRRRPEADSECRKCETNENHRHNEIHTKCATNIQHQDDCDLLTTVASNELRTAKVMHDESSSMMNRRMTVAGDQTQCV